MPALSASSMEPFVNQISDGMIRRSQGPVKFDTATNYIIWGSKSLVQGYLAHKKQHLPPQDHHIALGIALL